MFQRCLLLAAGIFCIVMNVMLWRMEISGKQLGAKVPLETVMKRVLNSPEIAQLDIFQRREWKRLGSLEWMMLVDEDAPSGEPDVEGMVRKIRGYTLDVSQGNLLLNQSHVKFSLRTNFDAARKWKAFLLTVQFPRGVISMESKREDGTVKLDLDLNGVRLKREMSFAQLTKLETLAALPAELTGDPSMAKAARQLAGPPGQQRTTGTRPTNTARAHYDWLPGIRHRLRVFRVNWTPVESYDMVLYISLQGEILRVELPRGIVIRNRDYYG